MERVERARRIVAAEVARARQCVPVPCAKACWGCCRGEVAVWGEEAPAIAAYVTPETLDRLAAQERAGVDPREALCPALDPVSKLCTMYDQRPLVCRAYIVGTPREKCYPEEVGVAEVGLIWEPMGEAAFAMDCEPTLTLREILTALLRAAGR